MKVNYLTTQFEDLPIESAFRTLRKSNERLSWKYTKHW